jgi:hypothetical protein
MRNYAAHTLAQESLLSGQPFGRQGLLSATTWPKNLILFIFFFPRVALDRSNIADDRPHAERPLESHSVRKILGHPKMSGRCCVN